MFMNSICTTFFFFLSILDLSYGQSRIDLNFMFDGRLRNAVISHPGKPAPVGGYPLVFMLHGTSGDGEKFYNISGWKELGIRENFITVFPSSLRWCFVDEGVEKHDTRWSCGSLTENPCAGPVQNYVDDVKFLKYLVSKLIDTFAINKSMIFASGFSSGSHMVHKLAMDAGDVFVAISGSGASISKTDSVSMPVHRIPIWTMFGNQEPSVIPPTLTELPFGGDSALVYLQNIFKRVLPCQGLTETFSKNETPITHTYVFTESQSMMSSSPYLFTLVKGMDHIYPSGKNFPLNAPTLFWEFFKSVALTSVNNIDREVELNLYPNPAQGLFQIKFSQQIKEVKIELINFVGEIKMKKQLTNVSQCEFITSELDPGTYFVRIQFDNRSRGKALVIMNHE